MIILVSNSCTLIEAETMNNKPIKMGLTVWVPNFLAYIAQEKGYFKKNNVDVNLTLIQNYDDAVNAYSNGELDGIFIVYSDVIMLHSQGLIPKLFIMSIHLIKQMQL